VIRDIGLLYAQKMTGIMIFFTVSAVFIIVLYQFCAGNL